jgi:hypothetical protein
MQVVPRSVPGRNPDALLRGRAVSALGGRFSVYDRWAGPLPDSACVGRPTAVWRSGETAEGVQARTVLDKRARRTDAVADLAAHTAKSVSGPMNRARNAGNATAVVGHEHRSGRALDLNISNTIVQLALPSARQLDADIVAAVPMD